MANDNDSVDSNGNSTDLRPRHSNRDEGKPIQQLEETDENVVVHNNVENEKPMSEYDGLSTDLLVWIRQMLPVFLDRAECTSVYSVYEKLNHIWQYHHKDKPPRLEEKGRLETIYNTMQTRLEEKGGLERTYNTKQTTLRVSNRPDSVPAEDNTIADIERAWMDLERAWMDLEKAEYDYEVWVKLALSRLTQGNNKAEVHWKGEEEEEEEEEHGEDVQGPQEATFECHICYQDVPEAEQCGFFGCADVHRFCTSCFREMSKEAAAKGFKVKCPLDMVPTDRVLICGETQSLADHVKGVDTLRYMAMRLRQARDPYMLMHDSARAKELIRKGHLPRQICVRCFRDLSDRPYSSYGFLKCREEHPFCMRCVVGKFYLWCPIADRYEDVPDISVTKGGKSYAVSPRYFEDMKRIMNIRMGQDNEILPGNEERFRAMHEDAYLLANCTPLNNGWF